MQSILIVDDEKNTREGLCRALGDDFDVFAASNADDAIKMLDAENFDAVLMELAKTAALRLLVAEAGALGIVELAGQALV